VTLPRWEVPETWKWAQASEVADIVGGGTPSTKDETNFAGPGLGVPWIGPADLTGCSDAYIGRGRRDLSEKGLSASGATLMPKGTVLFSSRAPIGYCAIAANEISTNQGFKSWVCASGVMPEYVRHYLLSSVEYADSLASGTTFREVSGKRISAMAFPVAPAAEQRRIVAKLDALTARLARARAELCRVAVLAERLRDQSLVAAFNGTLIEEDGEPRSAWRTVRFDEAAEIASNLVDPAGIRELPHIAPNHIASGRPKLLSFKTIAEDGVISGKHRFYPGQIIYSKIRPYLRKVVRVDFEGACSADMYPINARCNARYLMYWMLSPEFTWLASQQEGRTVLPKINQKALSSIPTPVAPEPVQAAIAARLDVVFARADRMEAEAARARALIDRLEAAILGRAFRGELVPQDPEDEPAHVLLDRIRAERAAAPKQKRGRRKKAET